MLWLLLILLLSAPALARDLPPVLLLLNGTGSAGKSSIGRALEKSLRHATFLSEERLVFLAYADILKRRKLWPRKPLHDLAELMVYRSHLSRASEANLRQEFRRRGCDFIGQETRRQIELAARQGYEFILLDDTLWKPEQVQVWKQRCLGYRSFHVVVYCPLSDLLEHVKKRNQSIYSYEHRDLALPLEMYFSMYPPSQGSHSIDTLEPARLTRDLEACAAYQRALNGQELPIRQYLQRLPAQVQIEPFFAYDLVVNTGQSTTHQCVEQIRRELLRRWLIPAAQALPGSLEPAEDAHQDQDGQPERQQQHHHQGGHRHAALFGG
ncbi:MAG: hypothetical protein U0931_28570 [Vulcanimicrobiota bacterium]